MLVRSGQTEATRRNADATPLQSYCNRKLLQPPTTLRVLHENTTATCETNHIRTTPNPHCYTCIVSTAAHERQQQRQNILWVWGLLSAHNNVHQKHPMIRTLSLNKLLSNRHFPSDYKSNKYFSLRGETMTWKLLCKSLKRVLEWLRRLEGVFGLFVSFCPQWSAVKQNSYERITINHLWLHHTTVLHFTH